MGDNKDEKKEQEEQTPLDSEAQEEEAQEEEVQEEEVQEQEDLAATGSEASEDAASEDAASEDAASEDEQAADEPATEEDAAQEAEEAEAGAAHVEVDSTGEPISVHALEGVAAFFEHPKHLLAAATYARDSDYESFDAYSPFPIHGMDEAMGLARSWIPWVTFGAGLTGFVLANLLQFGTMTFDWPMIIGGKPFAPWPSFVPIMFELTVLLAGVTTAVVMLKAAGCFKKPMIIDPSITDDRFVLWISAEDKKFNVDEVIDFMEDLNPLEVRKIVKDA